MSKITLTLKVLGDGNWHQIEALQSELGLGVYEMQKVMVFLEKYGFATVDSGKLRVKVNPDFQKLLIAPTI
jgi:hypothetical protein